MFKKNHFNLIILFLIITVSSCRSDIQKTSANPDKDSTNVSEVFTTDSFMFYENILENDSLNTNLHLALATNYYTEKQFDKAIEHLIFVCRIDETNAEAFITLGNIYYDTEKNEQAITAYEKALTLDGKNVDVRCDLATSYLNIKNTEKSIQLLKYNINIAPEHAQSHHNLSVIYSQIGKAKEAETELKIFNKLSR